MEELDTTLSRNNPPEDTDTGRLSYATMTWVYIIASVLFALLIIDTLNSFRTLRTWHVLVEAGSSFVGLVLLQFSFRYYRTEKYSLSEALIPLIIIFSTVPLEFAYTDMTIVNLTGGVLILIFMGLLIRPKNPNVWIALTFLYAILTLLASQYQGIEKFPIAENSPSWYFASVAVIVLFLVGTLWQIFARLQQATIRTRLMITFVVLGTIPVAAVAAISSTIGYQSGSEQVTHQISTVIDFKVDQLNIFLDNQTQILDNTLKRDNLTYDFYRMISAPLSPLSVETAYNAIRDRLNFTVDTSDFIEMMVIDRNGNVIISTDAELEGQDVSTADYFINGSQDPYTQPVQIGLTVGEDYGSVILIQALPLYSETGTRIGVIAGQIDFRVVNELLVVSEEILGETGEIYLINNDHILLSRTRETLMLPGFSVVDTLGARTVIERRTTGSGLYTNYNREDVLGYFRYIPEIGAAVIGEEIQSEAFAAVQLNLMANIMVMVATITISAGLALVISRGIARPIAELARKATVTAQGDLNQDFTVEQRDEVGELSQALNIMTDQMKSNLQNLEDIVADRTAALERRARSLEATAEIGRAATQIYNLDNLLNSVTHLISERFGFYHVGIFLLDEAQEWAVLSAANSEGGWRMLNRGHRLRVGEQGIVGFVTGNRMPRVQQKVGDDEVYYDNPDLPLTRSEMALPMMVAGELLGALDVQSTEESAFTEDDVEFLQVLADEVAMAINNTRLFEQLQERLEAERRFFGELSSEAWMNMQQSGATNYGYRSDQHGTQLVDQSLSPLAQQAMQRKQVTYRNLSPDGATFPIAVPIKIHGDLVVAVVETYKNIEVGPWTSDEIHALEAISEQVGIALENARLFEETQRLARRERIAADVAGKVWSSPNMDTILQTAVQELSKALNASQGTIRLSLTEDNGQSDEEVQTFEIGADEE